jgi:hypothetical protein
MAYKRMHAVAAHREQLVAAIIAAAMLAWLITRPAIHWTSWVLAAIVLPMTLYFGWPRKSRLRCEGCGRTMPAGETL